MNHYGLGSSLTGQKKVVTILIPCFNEEAVFPLTLSRLTALATSKTENVDYQVLFVDDGSTDNTQALIREASQKFTFIQYIFLSRNFGKEKALFAGIENIDSDATVIIDADLQDPPELIPEMVKLWEQGYEDVYARRRSRSGETFLKKTTSKLYYRILQHVTNVKIQPDTGDFRLLDHKCIEALKNLSESERNSKALFSWIGFKKIEFLYDREERAAGKTKWNYWNLFRLAIDGITSFTTAPLKLATLLGAFTSTAAIFYAIYIFIRTLIEGIEVPGYSSLLIFILLLGGIQLLSLGIIGEYLGRIFIQTKNRPNYLIEETSLANRK